MSNDLAPKWASKTLKDLATLEYGKSPSEVSSQHGTFDIIGTSGVVGKAKNYLFDGESVVIGRKGTIDKPIHLMKPFWAIDTTYYSKFTDNTHPRWFFYRICFEQLEKYNEASGVPSLGRETLYSIHIQTPPLKEQQKIAEILTSVDEVIENTQSQIDKLEDLKKATMNELLTKGIGHTEFKETEIGRIPMGWKLLRLNQLVDQERPITYGIVQTGTHIPNGIPCLRVVDMVRRPEIGKMIRTSNQISSTYKRTILKKNDITFALRGDIGRVCLADSSLEGINLTRGVALISSSDKIHPEFLFWSLQGQVCKSEIRDGVNGSALQEIPLANLKSIHVPIPPDDEQIKITSILNQQTEKICHLDGKFNALRSLKKSLMQDLLTGKVRVKVN